MIATLDCIVPKTKQRVPPACHSFGTDRDARDGRCPRSRPDATLLATDHSTDHSTLRLRLPLWPAGGGEIPHCHVQLGLCGALSSYPPQSPKPRQPSIPPQLFEIGGQRHRATSPPLAFKCLVRPKSKTEPTCLFSVRTQVGRETRRDADKRKGRHTHSAEATRSIMARPCQPRRLQLRFARGRRYCPPVARTPLSEELPRLVHHRPGHHPNYGPCFQEARLGQDTSLSS